MQLMPRPLIALLFLPALLLFACGGDSESDKVESVIRSYIDHYLDSEPAEMYALLDSDSQERCTQDSFVAFISSAREALDDRSFEISEIQNLVIDGDTASATVISTIDGELADPTENDLVKEDGEWKLKLPSIGC
jgi:hypothetical protein